VKLKALRIKVGSTYQTKGGLEAKIERVDSKYHYPFFGYIIFPAKEMNTIPTTSPTCWTSEGKYFTSVESPWDLFQEVISPLSL
jgi:hypothetical protein